MLSKPCEQQPSHWTWIRIYTLPDRRISSKRLFTWRHYPSAQPAGDDWLRIQISMSCANFWYSPPLKFVPWDVKQTNKVTVFDISQGTSFLCGRILQNSARLYEIVSESISIHPGRNSEIVAPDFGEATIYDFECRSSCPRRAQLLNQLKLSKIAFCV